MANTYEKQVEKIRELEIENKYNEAKRETDKLKCKYLLHMGEEFNLREIVSFSNWRDMNEPGLKTLGEEFGNREQKEYEEWTNQSESNLNKLYKCSLTEDYCVARKTGFCSADLPSGDVFYVSLEIDIQKRCPAYENNLEKK